MDACSEQGGGHRGGKQQRDRLVPQSRHKKAERDKTEHAQHPSHFCFADDLAAAVVAPRNHRLPVSGLPQIGGDCHARLDAGLTGRRGGILDVVTALEAEQRHRHAVLRGLGNAEDAIESDGFQRHAYWRSVGTCGATSSILRR